MGALKQGPQLLYLCLVWLSETTCWGWGAHPNCTDEHKQSADCSNATTNFFSVALLLFVFCCFYKERDFSKYVHHMHLLFFHFICVFIFSTHFLLFSSCNVSFHDITVASVLLVFSCAIWRQPLSRGPRGLLPDFCCKTRPPCLCSRREGWRPSGWK